MTVRREAAIGDPEFVIPEGCMLFTSPLGVDAWRWWKVLRSAGLVKGVYVKTRWVDGLRVADCVAPGWAIALTNAVKPTTIEHAKRVFQAAGKNPDFAAALDVVWRASGHDALIAYATEMVA